MTNYRTYKAIPVTGSSNLPAPKQAWGVLVAAGSSGSISLGDIDYAASGSTSTIKLEHLVAGTPFPCYVNAVTCSLGTAYILA